MQRGFRPTVARWLVLAGASLLLAACLMHEPSIEARPDDPRAQSVTDEVRALDLSARGPQEVAPGSIGQPRPSRPAIYLGDPNATVSPVAGGESAAASDGYDLNFENAPVTTVAKVILGDILNVGYTIDPRVQGTVTLTSGRPVSKADALFVLEAALRMSNVALVHDREGYRLIPAADAVGGGSLDAAAATRPGYGLSVVPLRYVSAQAITKLLDGFGIRPNSVRVDTGRNLLVIQGSGVDRRSAVQTVLSFDADWMRGQSVGVFPIQNSTPEPIIAEIEKIMDSGEGGLSQNMIKFQAVSRLNAILVVSRKPAYLKTAASWIRRLDASDTEGVNLKVYRLRYGSAKQIAGVLNEILVGRATGGLDTASSQIAPGTGVSLSSSGGPLAALSALPTSSNIPGSAQSAASASTGARPVTPGLGGTGTGTATPATGTSTGTETSAGAFGATAGGGGRPTLPPLQNVRITADVANNSILVYANQEAHRIVEQTLRQIDRPLVQVAIEATIAEVTLNDTLSYGVQFYLNSHNIGLPNPDAGSVVNTIGTQTLARVLPGFNLLVGPEAMPNLILNALHNVTDVKVLSNPSVVVLDNQTATLQVGDQVPISTGSATVLTANNTVVNTIDYRNTGIILRVVPRVSANGNVVLEIEQEISGVTPGSANSLTPTISNRKVKSSISVAAGQTVLLAGLIRDETDRTRQGIPVLDKIPGIGDAFGNQSGTKQRDELIIFIRPTVIRDSVDAQHVAEELRSKLSGEQVGGNFPGVMNGPVVRP